MKDGFSISPIKIRNNSTLISSNRNKSKYYIASYFDINNIDDIDFILKRFIKPYKGFDKVEGGFLLKFKMNTIRQYHLSTNNPKVLLLICNDNKITWHVVGTDYFVKFFGIDTNVRDFFRNSLHV